MKIDYVYDPVYQLTQEVVQVNGSVTTNYWKYDEAGNVLKAPGQFGTAQASVNADNELTAWTQVANQLTVTGQVEPGSNSNKWYDSTAQARGQSGLVGTSDGAFSIPGVPVTPGLNALTVTVTDVSGNVATQWVSFTVAATNQWGFTHDSNGNIATATNQLSAISYSYDAENRLTSVTSNGVAVLQCWYDGTGHRVAKREILGTQTNAFQYVWDGWNLAAVLGSDGQLKEHFTRGVGVAGDIGTLVAATHYTNGSATATYYLHNNHRGDVILARQGTNTVATLDYAPYGELRSQTGTYTPRFRFSSKEYDASTGFYHFPYRFYAPMWARWMAKDPIVVDLSWLNQFEFTKTLQRSHSNAIYGYAKNSPLNFTDADGRIVEPIVIGVYLEWCRRCATPIADEGRRTYPFTEDERHNHMRHCWTSCRVRQKCGGPCAFTLGWLNEILGTYDEKDVEANAKGRNCASSGDCASCCQKCDPSRN